MNFKKTLKKIIPQSILDTLIDYKYNRKFKQVNSINCNTSKLLSKGSVNLTEIFNSEEINSSWNESKKELDTLNIPSFKGGVNPGDRRAIFYLVKYFTPNSVLEIGTHIGASTVHITSAIHNKNQILDKTQSMLKTVDIQDVNSISEKPWLKFGSEKSPIEMIKSLKQEAFVKFITDTSLNYLETSSEKFDFIFLDGDHSREGVYKEIPLALKKLNKNGVILLHDYFPNCEPLWSDKAIIKGPYMATERHIENGADISIIPLGNLPWVTKLDSNITSLALLLKNN